MTPPKKVQALIFEEEEAFNRTLDRGLTMFDKVLAGLPAGSKLIPGKAAATLYDTYGFPVDLTQRMAEENKMNVDMAGFHTAMEELKALSKAGKSKLGGKEITFGPVECDRLASELKIAATDDEPKYDWTTKGDGPSVTATVKAIYLGDSKFVTELKQGDIVAGIVLDKTNFYAIKGGQVEDTGSMTGPNCSVDVLDVQPYPPYVLHVGTVSGALKVGDKVKCEPDYARRAMIAKNHTTTHLLNFALRTVLGDDIEQKGSIVNERYSRFDFNFNKPLTVEQVEQIEKIVQAAISKKEIVSRESVSLSDAQKIKGLRFLAGAAYPDPVRVVAVGASVKAMVTDPNNPKWNNSSVEFCGGTHLDNASEAEIFKIVSEDGVSKGVRRIEAWTSQAARDAVAAGDSLLKAVKAAHSTPAKELTSVYKRFAGLVGECQTTVSLKAALNAEVKILSDLDLKNKKTIAAAAEKEALASIDSLVAQTKKSQAKFLVMPFKVFGNSKALKTASEKVAEALPDVPTLFYSAAEDNGALAVITFVPASNTKGLNAQDWANGFLAPCDGKGGGKGTTCTGASRTSEKIAQAVEAGKQLASKF